jgi:hypothetical protein
VIEWHDRPQDDTELKSKRLRFDPVPALLESGNAAVRLFTRRDLFGEAVEPIYIHHAFLWTVANGILQLQEIIDVIASYQLTRLGTSLPDKLQLASGFITAGDFTQSCQVLTGFLNQVRAQTGKALTVQQATELTTRVIRIRHVIAC